MNQASVGATVLVVDDDVALGEMLSIALEAQGFAVTVARDGVAGLEQMRQMHPDIILLDIMLPRMDGIEVARRIRQVSQVPIIMLTAKSGTQDIVRGLDAGADDYVVKPFRVAELVARIHANLRREASVASSAMLPGSLSSDGHSSGPADASAALVSATLTDLRSGDIHLSVSEHVATRRGKDLDLTPLEFDLLTEFLMNPDKALSRMRLLHDVWGYDDAEASDDVRLIAVHVQRLREKVEDDPREPKLIQTVRGIGYKYVPAPSATGAAPRAAADASAHSAFGA